MGLNNVQLMMLNMLKKKALSTNGDLKLQVFIFTAQTSVLLVWFEIIVLATIMATKETFEQLIDEGEWMKGSSRNTGGIQDSTE